MDARSTEAIREVVLTRGYVAIIDEADWPIVSQFKWHATKARNSTGWYASACLSKALQEQHGFRHIKLHQLILGRPGGIIDHRDGNGLNNRRENLRVATVADNARNSRKQVRATTSRFKGVSWSKKFSCWAVYLCVNSKNKFLGHFKDEEEAGRCYDIAATFHYGQFARLNFPLLPSHAEALG